MYRNDVILPFCALPSPNKSKQAGGLHIWCLFFKSDNLKSISGKAEHCSGLISQMQLYESISAMGMEDAQPKDDQYESMNEY